MAIKVIDGGQIHDKFDHLLKDFLPFAQKKLGYNKPVDIQLVSDPDNAKDPLGKTAYYDPNLMRITIFVDKRHVKDILRSLSHELVHHKQNCEGQLSNIKTGEGYAQSDPHLREMEIEAEDKTNTLLLRDWEDQYKRGDLQMKESILKEAVSSAIKFVQQEQEEGGLNPAPRSQDVWVKLAELLRSDDNIPHQEHPQLVEIIVDKVKAIMGTSGGIMAEEVEEEKEPEKRSTNENWARVGKDKQLFEELLTRWCK